MPIAIVSRYTLDFEKFGADVLSIANTRDKSGKAVCRECGLSSNVFSMLVRETGTSRIGLEATLSLAKWAGLDINNYIIKRHVD